MPLRTTSLCFANIASTGIKNFTHFLQLTQDTNICDQDLLLSFDMCNLCIEVPIDETLWPKTR